MTITRVPQKKADAKKMAWRVQGIHEIKCTKSNCHFYSATANLDSTAKSLPRTHEEAALASTEAYNDYEQDGVWPVAHDEARLAASVAVAMRRQSATLAESTLSWALDRNPAIHEIWQAAAAFSSLNRQRSAERQKLPSRMWYNKLGLTQVNLLEEEALAVATAERFAQDRLLSAKHQDFLRRYPVLHKSLIAKVCGVIASPDSLAKPSNATLADIIGCQVSNKQGALEEMIAAADDVDQKGNSASEAFEEMLAKLKNRLAAKDQAAVDVLHKLLADLSVGYVNVRSQTFFAEHRRVVLRGPYAHLLKVAGAFLEQKERIELLEKTKIILESPEDSSEHADRIRCDDEHVLDSFMDWVPKHRSVIGHIKASENAAVSDDIDGGQPLDGAGLEVMQELRLDQEAEAELAEEEWSADFHESHSSDGHDERHDLDVLLPSLLDLAPPESLVESPDSIEFPQMEEPLVSLDLLQQQAEDELSDCVADVERRFSASFWTR